MPHICLFDIDGTLLRTGGAGMAALQDALAAEFRIADVTGVPTSGRTDRAIIRDLFKLHGVADTEDHWQRFCAAYLRRLPESLVQLPGCVLPGVVNLLARLARHKDVVLGLLTGNLEHGARLKLTHYDLFEYFRFGAFGDVHVDRDDIARAALAMAQRRFHARVTGDDVWVIGDTPLDVRCARAIGARCIAVTTGLYSRNELAQAKPDLLLDDLTQTGIAWPLAAA